MDKPKPAETVFQELLADLTPEELEPRLELQLFLDPMTSIGTAVDQQQQQQQQQQQKPPVETIGPIDSTIRK